MLMANLIVTGVGDAATGGCAAAAIGDMGTNVGVDAAKFQLI